MRITCVATAYGFILDGLEREHQSTGKGKERDIGRQRKDAGRTGKGRDRQQWVGNRKERKE